MMTTAIPTRLKPRCATPILGYIETRRQRLRPGLLDDRPYDAPWGDMNQEGWQKVLDFSLGAGIVKDRAKAPSAKEGLLWTNKYAGR